MRTLKTTMLVVDQQLIPAKVPILRIKCGGAFSDIIVDLNVNNSVAIRNTHLLCYYSACKFFFILKNSKVWHCEFALLLAVLIFYVDHFWWLG